ncbi:MAG: GAF domain-containing protein [Kangiellaceae bacterium]|jgi:GAF domain-containing protein|nr:GAF domain-containing protein [Kangiellaceae bacterium]
MDQSKAQELLHNIRVSLNMEMALFSHIVGNDYTVMAIDSELDIAKPGDVLELTDCLCSAVANSGKTVHYHKIKDIEELREHPVVKAVQPESYLGEPVIAGGKFYGTLSLLSLTPRANEFDETDRANATLAANKLAQLI